MYFVLWFESLCECILREKDTLAGATSNVFGLRKGNSGVIWKWRLSVRVPAVDAVGLAVIASIMCLGCRYCEYILPFSNNGHTLTLSKNITPRPAVTADSPSHALDTLESSELERFHRRRLVVRKPIVWRYGIEALEATHYLSRFFFNAGSSIERMPTIR